MASSSGCRKKRLVSSLDGDVLERLSMKLNPRMLLKDYQSLAGKLKYTYEYIRNFARDSDPTLALLQHWWSSKRGKEKTVTLLIEHLTQMERDDAVELLRPYEFCSNSREAAEYDETFDRPVVIRNVDTNRYPGTGNDHYPSAAAVQTYNPGDTTRFSGHQGTANFQNQRANFSGNYQLDSRFSRREDEHHQRSDNDGAYASASAPEFVASPNPQDRPTSSTTINRHLVDNGTEEMRNTFDSMHLPGATSLDYFSERPTKGGAFKDAVSSRHHKFPYHDPSKFGSLDSFYSTPSERQYDAADGFYGARRDTRLLGFQHPHTLDGSSFSSHDSHQYNNNWTGGGAQGLYKYENVRMSFKNEPNGRYNEQYQGDFDPRYMQQNFASPAAAEGHTLTAAADKVALVIGNQDYHHKKLQGLQYPRRDAGDVAATLSQLNFKVVSLVDLTLAEMRTAMLAFCCLLGKDVYGVVYFAGHGYEDSGENFLLPVDADLKYNREHSLRTQEILEAMQHCDTSLNLLIIDACRVSLPNKSGIKVPRIKRNGKGNNIFAYSCCSQQESLEEPNCRNGMYCSHLLQRLRENRRVENILMDVASDFARTYNLDQRPCLETDSKLDFRLTDQIQRGMLPDEFAERARRWNEARQYPDTFSVNSANKLKFVFQFHAPFCNVLCVSVTAMKITADVPVADVELTLQTNDPVHCREINAQELTGDDGVVVCTYEITNIQKMYKLQEPLFLMFATTYAINRELVHFDKSIDLGWPLVSSIMCLWDSWLLGKRCNSTAV